MSKIISVIGATGIQGGSVARALLDDGGYTVRAITRNPQSAAAKQLACDGAKVVSADLDDVESLRLAFAGSHAIFATTDFFAPIIAGTAGVDEAIETETRRGINLARAAADTPTLAHYVWSTLPDSRRISSGRTVVPHYEAKNAVDRHIRSELPALLRKTTFLWITFYASNMNYPFYKPSLYPTLGGPERYVQLLASPPSVPIKLSGDAPTNVGLFVRAILAQPEKASGGRTVIVETDQMTAGELLATWASVRGTEATYVQVAKKTYYGLWPVWGELMDQSHIYWDLVGDQAFTTEGGDAVLTREDLDVVGLVDTAAALARMNK